jgi:pyrroline-5-carboxylate reductase
MKICFIGGGNMTTALISGLIAQGSPPASISAVEPLAEARERLSKQFGVTVHAECNAAVSEAEIMVLAVKPQKMREALAALKPFMKQQLVISIAAGIFLADISRWLGGHRRLVRSMPNLTAFIRQGMAGLFALPEVSEDDRQATGKIMSALGETMWVQNEAMIDAITATSGSGPAYVFYFIEALQQGAEKLGFSEADARKLALSTFRGAALLAEQSADSPATLRQRVTSKAGTTEAAIAQLDKHGVKPAIMDAMEAARARGHALGTEFGKD